MLNVRMKFSIITSWSTPSIEIHLTAGMLLLEDTLDIPKVLLLGVPKVQLMD